MKPTTRAKRHRIEHEEARFDFAVLEQAIAARTALDIRTMDAVDTNAEPVAPATTVPADVPVDKLVILDIRHPDDQERRPLTGVPYAVEKLPFFRLNTRFNELPASMHYLLYCDKGVMSNLHAAYLKEQGHANVGVYRKSR